MSLLLLALACNGNTVPGTDKGDDTAQPDDTSVEVDDTGDDTGDTEDTGPPVDTWDPAECDDLPEPPWPTEKLQGYTSSEDFAFDDQGRMVSIDGNGNIVQHTKAGEKTVLLPGFGEGAGMAFGPDGYLYVSNVYNGTVDKVGPDGSSEILTAGIPYPNGLTLDPDGNVYVTEHSRGNIRFIPADGSEYEIIASGLYAPNGMAFSPDFETLYVNSFGGGVVYAMTQGDDGWDVETIGDVRSAGELGLCDGQPDGTQCVTGGALGECEAEVCVFEDDVDACDGLAAGDECTTTFDAESITAKCVDNGDSLFCPSTELAVTEGCEGKSVWSGCGGGGYCVYSHQQVLSCYSPGGEGLKKRAACKDLAEGDACIVADPIRSEAAECITQGENMSCDIGGAEAGGLDGLEVDECGNIYVTEYVLGRVWRFPEGGGHPELVSELPSYWIPNLHWGNGIGGWDGQMLYVQDRDSNGIYELDVGFGGRPLPF